MLTKVYTNFDIENFTVVSEAYINTGSSSGTKLQQTATSNGTMHARGSSFKSCDAVIQLSGELDFTRFPAIPDTAIIASIVIEITLAGTANGNGTFKRIICTLTKTYNTVPVNVINSFNTQVGGAQIYNVNSALTATDLTVTTKAGLIAAYSSIGLLLESFVSDGPALHFGELCSSSIQTTDFSITINYDLDQYSWYIKPTIKIVNGIPIQLIADAALDIIPIIDGDPIPRGYVFYGTGEDFPDGLEYLWWYSEDVYEFYILTLIDPTVEDSPLARWLRFSGIPTCTNCTSVALETATILVADASGIYKFDKTIKHDKLYVREGFSVFVDTINVKIPNPFARTGFIP